MSSRYISCYSINELATSGVSTKTACACNKRAFDVSLAAPSIKIITHFSDIYDKSVLQRLRSIALKHLCRANKYNISPVPPAGHRWNQEQLVGEAIQTVQQPLKSSRCTVFAFTCQQCQFGDPTYLPNTKKSTKTQYL